MLDEIREVESIVDVMADLDNSDRSKHSKSRSSMSESSAEEKSTSKALSTDNEFKDLNEDERFDLIAK